MGKLIVFEGIDGSGKSTQFRLLCDRLRDEGVDFQSITFPQYSEPSSALIRMYLAGQFGEDPSAVNPYAASSFYAVDRYASYVSKWGRYYKSGGVIITDRYTTSNAIHQGGKLTGGKRREYFRWLYDYEFERMGLPRPDKVLYMRSPIEVCEKRMRLRESQTNTSADIHEKNSAYLRKCHDCALEAADFYSWDTVDCMRGAVERTPEDIAGQIYDMVISEIKK
ncbi:MAG: deoxynucleoside kinase [Oscillospiraceae bacterium]|nr:deoxynucleoside kinase [Oscillospiraceae bacterium]